MMAEEPKQPLTGVPKLVDAGLRTFSWAFLPIIFFTGLSLAAANGATFPIRVGAPRDPLDFPAQSYVREIRSPLLLAAARDPVFDDLTDTTSAARSLSLPKSEQRREAALQELEDERLERCRSTSPFSFDQCFFFGSMDAADSRRAMEGAGTLVPTKKPALPRTGGQPTPPRSSIPTW